MKANNIKNDVIKNWSDNFVDLSVHTQNKLYKICGAFLFGIEILNLPRTEVYRPIFVCYPLWKKDIKQCNEEPIFIQEIYNKKGFQFNIPYIQHTSLFHEAIDCTKKQVPILEHQSIYKKDLYEVFNKQFSQTLIKSSPVGQAKLFEAKFLGALYLNDINTVKQVFNELKIVSMSWSPNLFEWKYGKLDIWLKRLQEMISNKDVFLNQIEENKQDKKILQLKCSEIIV